MDCWLNTVKFGFTFICVQKKQNDFSSVFIKHVLEKLNWVLTLRKNQINLHCFLKDSKL